MMVKLLRQMLHRRLVQALRGQIRHRSGEAVHRQSVGGDLKAQHFGDSPRFSAARPSPIERVLLFGGLAAYSCAQLFAE